MSAGENTRVLISIKRFSNTNYSDLKTDECRASFRLKLELSLINDLNDVLSPMISSMIIYNYCI